MSVDLDKQDVDSSRLRNLTDAGNSLYRKTADDHIARIAKSRAQVERLIDSVESLPEELQELQDFQANINTAVDQHETLCKDYTDFLTRTRTQNSATERDIFEHKHKGYQILIDSTKRSLRNRIAEILRQDERSSGRSSARSKSSHVSNT